jgi:phage repressor protein C with HTH and peptisase S24 domain
MFNSKVNTVCNTSCLVRPIIALMHIQMERLYRAAKELKDIKTQAELARALNQSSQTVKNWESRGISSLGLLKAQASIGCSATWLTTGEGAMIVGAQAARLQDDDGFIASVDADTIEGAQRVRVGSGPETIPVRAVKLRLQAGVSGFVAEPDLDVDHGYFQVPTYVIEKLQLNPANLIIMSVAGRSMEPMYFEDDKVLVDTSKRTPKNNECFAVNWNGEPIVKCLIRKTNDWCLYSFNNKFPSMSVRSGQCSIIGQVVWQPDRIVVGLL